MSVRRILVVDDDKDIREVVQLSLEKVAGWQVVAVSSGREALLQAQSDSMDAILLDVMMPDMDGPTTYQHLQSDEKTRDVPVIFLTAKIQAADRRRFEELGVSCVIAKPFDPLKLAGRVADLLGWKL
jgi:CheY-like chemotaxis protein